MTRKTTNLGYFRCIGESWTDCINGFTWRRKLSQDLVSAGWAVHFVGTLETTESCEVEQSFDRDHNGISSISAQEVLNNRLSIWLDTIMPDTVLILLGGNHIRQGSSVSTILTRLSLIIDRIRETNPDVVIQMAIYVYVIVDIPD